ncbi:hypothetical protein PINS_up005253 [Pythium insidiosum]|nr:hypothetical protein PINS_up005253 [Pythium insidiosum]
MNSRLSPLLAAFALALAFAASTDAAANETMRNVSQPLVGFVSIEPCTSDVVQSPRFSTRVRFTESPSSKHSSGRSNDLWLLDIKLSGPQGAQLAVFLTPEGQRPSPDSPVAVVEQDAPCVWQLIVPSAGVAMSYDELHKCSPRPEYLVNMTLSSVTALCANDPSHRACKYKDEVVGDDKVQDVTETTTCKRVSLASLPKVNEKTSVAASAPSLSSAVALFALVSAAATSSMMMMSSIN